MDNKYRIDTMENREFVKRIQQDLLRFGEKFPAETGASYYLGMEGKPMTERPLETWITCRMAHVYSLGYLLGYEQGKELTRQAIKGLTGVLKDRENGGWYPGITAEGKPMKDKQCYAHAFVILAASSASLLGIEEAKELLKEAMELYDKRFWNEEEGLCCDTWNTEFTHLESYRGINANMHTVEAFLAAADVLKEEKYRRRAGRIIEKVIVWAKENEWRIPEHFSEDWKPQLEYNRERPDDPFKPYGATPGHGLEWSRLILQWAVSTYEDEKEQKPYVEASMALYERARNDGWYCDGEPGVVYTTDWKGNPIVSDRMHWTLAEAINTAAVLYRKTEKEKYANDYAEYMKYLDEKVLDYKYGSWYHQLDEKNRLKETVWPGKSDLYHAIQATLIPYSHIGKSICVAVKEERNAKSSHSR